MPFVNRKDELNFLEERYRNGSKPQFIVIYGKRRVGKTELVKQFFKDKPHIYYLADKLPQGDQLRELSRRVGAFFKDQFLMERGFGNWSEFFLYLKNKRKEWF